MSYNGWNSYETWLIHLHLTNDAGVYEHIRECIENTFELREFVLEFIEYYDLSGFAADLIKAAVDNADWKEILEEIKAP